MQQRSNPENDFEKLIQDVTRFFNQFKKGGGKSGGLSFGNIPGVYLIIVVILVVILAINTFYIIEPEEQGVIVRFGRYSETTEPGPHMKIPFVDQVFKVKSKRRQEQEFGYRENTANDQSAVGRVRVERRAGRVNFGEESLMLSGDLNLADVQWSVQYEISDPRKFLFRAREVDRNIRDVSMSVMRRVVGDMFVGDVLTTRRAEISIQTKDLMQETLDHYDLGVRITTVVLQSVNPPESVRPAFNDVNAAKQEQEQAINRAESDYNKIIPEARGKADQHIADASAFAIRTVNAAKGDAARFTSMLKEYSKAPAITKKRMYLDVMEEVFSNVDKFTVVDSKVKGILPVFGTIPGMSGLVNESAENAKQ